MPTISVTPGDIGQKTDKNNLLTYSITTDGEMSTITEKINGTVVNTRNTTSGQAVTLGLTQAQWDAIRFGKYADATGGKNTLTVEMGTDKWTYTFDKRLATDADIVSAVKATQDANEVYLPAQINRLAEVARGKGAVIPSNPKFDDVIDGIKNSANGRKASGSLTSSSASMSFLTQAGSNTTSYFVQFDSSLLGFTPSEMFFYKTDKSVLPSTHWRKDNFYETGGNYANAQSNGSFMRVPYINGVFNIPVGYSSSSYTWFAYE